MPENDDDENSAEWADTLQKLDSGSTRVWSLPATARTEKKNEVKKQEKVIEKTVVSKKKEDSTTATLPPPPMALPFLPASELTQRIRQQLAEKVKDSKVAARLVLQVCPSILASQKNCYLLVAYFDHCPYSRATEDGLVSLAYRMYRRNLAKGSSVAPLSIAMYDTKAEGNRSFAAEQLKASSVPKLFLFDARRRAIVPWQGEPMSEVRPNANSSTGGWTRTLPEQALMDALEQYSSLR